MLLQALFALTLTTTHIEGVSFNNNLIPSEVQTQTDKIRSIESNSGAWVETARLPNSSMPPARFDHPYAGKIVITFVYSFKNLQQQCNYGFETAACAVVVDGVCNITMPEMAIFGDGYYEDVFYHERAHCNGWTAKHES